MNRVTTGRCFIAGGTGFIGKALIARLRAQGHPVVTLARSERSTPELERLGAELVRGDVTDPAVVDRAMAGCELAFNLAVSRSRQPHGFEQNRRVNVQGAENVARAAARHRVTHLVHASTCGVYGVAYPGRPFDEQSPIRADTNYRETKGAGERAVTEVATESGLSLTIARLTSIYGPGSDKVWRDLARGIAAKGRFTMIGRGRNYHHLTFVDDCVEGLYQLAILPRDGIRCYNLGADPIPTFRQILDAVAAAIEIRYRVRSLPAWPFTVFRRVSSPLLRSIGRELPLNQAIKFFTVNRAYDTTRLRTETGFQSTVSIEEGMQRTLTWIETNGDPGKPSHPNDEGSGGE